MRKFLFFILLPLLIFSFKIPKPTFSGDFSSYTETWGSDRKDNKRPSFTYRFSLSTSVAFPYFVLGLGLFYTSEDRFTAQRVNQFNLNPSWKWGRIDFGDFSPQFSSLTLSGIQLRGIGINLYPKSFRFALVGWETKRARDTIEKSYKRNLYGMRLGATFFTVNIIKAKDDKNSLKGDTLPNPQENLVLGLESNFSLFKIISFSLEGATGLHTRDLRSDTIFSKEIPKFIYKVYEPRYSSRIDFALRSGIGLAIPTPPLIKNEKGGFNIDFSFNYIGPGYTSLGVPYLKNNDKSFKLILSTPLIPKTFLSFSLERNYNILIKDTIGATIGKGFSISFRFNPIKKITFQTSYQEKNTEKEAIKDSFEINNKISSFNFSSNFNYQLFGKNQNSNINFNHQRYKNLARYSNIPSNSHIGISLNHTISLERNFSLSFSFNHSISISQSEKRGQSNLSLSFNYRLLSEKLNNTLNLSYSLDRNVSSLKVSQMSNYSLTKRDLITLNLNFGFHKGFNERQASLSYNRKIF